MEKRNPWRTATWKQHTEIWGERNNGHTEQLENKRWNGSSKSSCTRDHPSECLSPSLTSPEEGAFYCGWWGQMFTEVQLEQWPQLPLILSGGPSPGPGLFPHTPLLIGILLNNPGGPSAHPQGPVCLALLIYSAMGFSPLSLRHLQSPESVYFCGLTDGRLMLLGCCETSQITSLFCLRKSAEGTLTQTQSQRP